MSDKLADGKISSPWNQHVKRINKKLLYSVRRPKKSGGPEVLNFCEIWQPFFSTACALVVEESKCYDKKRKRKTERQKDRKTERVKETLDHCNGRLWLDCSSNEYHLKGIRIYASLIRLG